MHLVTWARAGAGLLIIGGTILILWLIYQPTIDDTVTPPPPPRLPPLHQARADVLLVVAGRGGPHRATISCNDGRWSATGFWAPKPREACDALASTRGALLAGPGCHRLARDRTRLEVSGGFGPRRFVHRAQFGGCPDPDQWLAVNALARPVLVPEQKATGAQRR
jgi:hypothetical protein